MACCIPGCDGMGFVGGWIFFRHHPWGGGSETVNFMRNSRLPGKNSCKLLSEMQLEAAPQENSGLLEDN